MLVFLGSGAFVRIFGETLIPGKVLLFFFTVKSGGFGQFGFGSGTFKPEIGSLKLRFGFLGEFWLGAKRRTIDFPFGLIRRVGFRVVPDQLRMGLALLVRVHCNN